MGRRVWNVPGRFVNPEFAQRKSVHGDFALRGKRGKRHSDGEITPPGRRGIAILETPENRSWNILFQSSWGHAVAKFFPSGADAET
jgi:hypothetical protein